MNQLVTTAIVLARTNYGEADRILTVLTPEYGKLRLLAKGVRRVKSKLAGGIELFSVSEITFIRGRGEIGTLVSTRLQTHYGHIAKELPRTMLGYELIKQLNRLTEDQVEPEYFQLLAQAFAGLDNPALTTSLVNSWFYARLLQLGGHAPNLLTTADGERLRADRSYMFDLDAMCFVAAAEGRGRFGADHIKFLRLLFAVDDPGLLARVKEHEQILAATAPLVAGMQRSYLGA